jgi:hypothetical protein
MSLDENGCERCGRVECPLPSALAAWAAAEIDCAAEKAADSTSLKYARSASAAWHARCAANEAQTKCHPVNWRSLYFASLSGPVVASVEGTVETRDLIAFVWRDDGEELAPVRLARSVFPVEHGQRVRVVVQQESRPDAAKESK